MEEATVFHTGLLRLGLIPTQSTTFWSRATADENTRELRRRALDEQWFPGQGEARVRYLVGQLQKRFPYPTRALLGFKPRPQPKQDVLVCHWHLQLTDPLYREYTSRFFLDRWSSPTTTVDLECTARWVANHPVARKWRGPTVRRMASGLLSAASQAGFCRGVGRGPRELKLPAVAPSDLDYLKKLLALAGAEKNVDTYLISVGHSEDGPEGETM